MKFEKISAFNCGQLSCYNLIKDRYHYFNKIT